VALCDGLEGGAGLGGQGNNLAAPAKLRKKGM
jgi:hypothetical protein